jgi:hypothetical protein
LCEIVFRILKGKAMNVDLSKENREIQQLWNAARLYWEELLNERAKISKTDMNKPIKCLVEKYEKYSEDYNKAFFRYSCHLGSCAIRLYSIDELIGSQTRHQVYTGWWETGCKKNPPENVPELAQIAHYLLRQMIAHHENKAKNKHGYNALKKKYEDSSHKELSNYIFEISGSMKTDLSASSIFVDEFNNF